MGKSRPKPKPEPALELDYVAALATANHFLRAWQTNDLETGVLLLTDSARQHVEEMTLRNFFRDPAPRAFEIVRGKRLRNGRYSFPVVLVQKSASGNQAHRKYSEMIVTRTGKDDWAVDKLP